MRQRRLATPSWVPVVLLSSLFVPGASAQDKLSDAVIFATNSVHLRQDTIVASGDVVVNDASLGPTLEAGAELGIDRNAMLAGDATANRITLDAGAVIQGTVSCNGGAGVSCGGLFLPVFELGEIPPFQEAALRDQAPDVVVGAGGSGALEAGDYADVALGAGARLTFGGGVYNIGSIVAGASSRLEFSGPAELRIVGRFSLGRSGYVGPAAGAAVGASNLILYVGGNNGSAADPSSQPPAARVGQQSVLRANFYVPAGTFHLRQNSTATGAFLARDVLIEQGSALHLASFFNPPPTADPQAVFTTGTAPLPITLTGSDPEGEPLVFSIVSAPTKGTLSGLTQVPPSSATVTYTANQAGDLADSFVFRVTDPNGGFGDAVVSINVFDDPGGPDDPTGTVIGKDDAFEAVTATPIALTLVGVADVADPTAVGDLTFAIVSGPSSGALDPNPPAPNAPELFGAVRTAATTYTSNPGFAGTDSFVFEVCGDLSMPPDGDTLDPGECDTATITLRVSAFAPPVPPSPPGVVDQTRMTLMNTPLEIDLTLEAGGGAPQPGDRPDDVVAPLVFPAAVAKVAETFGSEAEFLAELDASTTYDFEQPTFPAASAIIGVVDGIDFFGRIGFAVNPPPPSGNQFMRGTGPSAPFDGPGVIDFSGLEVLPNAVGFFTGFGSIAAPAPLVRVRIFFADESVSTYFIAHDPPGGSYFGFIDTEQSILTVDFQGFEADFETEAVAKQFGIDDFTVGTASDVAQPDLVVSSLTHAPASPIEETSIDFTAVVANAGTETAGESTLCFEIGGESCELDPESTLFAVPSLEPEESFSVTRSATLLAGTYQNTAVADYQQDVAESDEENNTTLDTYVVAPAQDTLFATITALPLSGTLFTQSGAAITSPGPIVGTKVTYLPALNSVSSAFFEFKLTSSLTGLSSIVARVDIFVAVAIDPCALVGRPPGCMPNFP